MAAVAATAGNRRTRLRYITERRGFLATLLISPAVLLIAALVGAPLVLAIYLSFTDATAGSLTGKWLGLQNFRAALPHPIFRAALWPPPPVTLPPQACVAGCAALLARAPVRAARGRGTPGGGASRGGGATPNWRGVRPISPARPRSHASAASRHRTRPRGNASRRR